MLRIFPFKGPVRAMHLLVLTGRVCPYPSIARTYFLIVFLTGLPQIGFDTNGVHMGATDAKLPACCTEFRRLSNGTSPGVKNLIIRQQQNQTLFGVSEQCWGKAQEKWISTLLKMPRSDVLPQMLGH